ncbi:hypothetical protein [Arthrobacter sp. 35W]|uniref:hypothetical protein n=1 Tax=Arthrobacter sp. 35W TaxID=1132441 RepID=UPI000558D953|nr:hypothetical protein [Arthrobacter sp. 35W]
MHSLILQFDTTTPSGDPTLRPGLDPNQVSPGFLGFIITFGIVVVMFFLIRDMVKRIRRVRYREQVSDDAVAAGAPAGAAGAHKVGGSHGPDAEYLTQGVDAAGTSGGAAAPADGTETDEPGTPRRD